MTFPISQEGQYFSVDRLGEIYACVLGNVYAFGMKEDIENEIEEYDVTKVNNDCENWLDKNFPYLEVKSKEHITILNNIASLNDEDGCSKEQISKWLAARGY